MINYNSPVNPYEEDENSSRSLFDYNRFNSSYLVENNFYSCLNNPNSPNIENNSTNFQTNIVQLQSSHRVESFDFINPRQNSELAEEEEEKEPDELYLQQKRNPDREEIIQDPKDKQEIIVKPKNKKKVEKKPKPKKEKVKPEQAKDDKNAKPRGKHNSQVADNALKKIFISFMIIVHNFFWNFLEPKIDNENIQIVIDKHKKYNTAKVTLKKLDANNTPEIISINIPPPSLTPLIAGPSEFEPIDPDFKYHHIEGVINRYQEILREKPLTMYLEYCLPKRTKETKEHKDMEDLLQRQKLRRRAYRKKMEEVLRAIWESLDGKDKDEFNEILNTDLMDFLYIYIDYGKSSPCQKIKCPNKLKQINLKLYGFKDYQDCKHNFSKNVEKQNHYQAYIIKLINDEITRRNSDE